MKLGGEIWTIFHSTRNAWGFGKYDLTTNLGEDFVYDNDREKNIFTFPCAKILEQLKSASCGTIWSNSDGNRFVKHP